MQYYEELQEADESRKKRLMAYCEYVDAKTKTQTTEVIHKLIACRQKQGLSQRNIAEATGMASANIARIESCKRIPTMQVLVKYAEAVGMEICIDVVPISEDTDE